MNMSTIQNLSLPLFQVLDAWVVCSPAGHGGRPFAICWTEESADELINTYYDNDVIAADREVDRQVFHTEPGLAQKYRVSVQALVFLMEALSGQERETGYTG